MDKWWPRETAPPRGFVRDRRIVEKIALDAIFFSNCCVVSLLFDLLFLCLSDVKDDSVTGGFVTEATWSSLEP